MVLQALRNKQEGKKKKKGSPCIEEGPPCVPSPVNALAYTAGLTLTCRLVQKNVCEFDCSCGCVGVGVAQKSAATYARQPPLRVAVGSEVCFLFWVFTACSTRRPSVKIEDLEFMKQGSPRCKNKNKEAPFGARINAGRNH